MTFTFAIYVLYSYSISPVLYNKQDLSFLADLSRVCRLLGILGNSPGFAELGQARNATFVAENLYAAAGDAPFCGGFGD